MKSKSRTGNAIINLTINMSYQIINTVANLILPPLLIGKFGSNINGLISTIKQIIGYIQLFGAGISESSVVSLYKPLNEKNYQNISAVFNASNKSFFNAGIIFSVFAAFLSVIYPFLINDSIDKLLVCVLTIILCLGGASEFFVIGKCRTLLIADQKMYIVNIAQILGIIFNVFITVLLIKLDANIMIVQLGGTIIYIMRIYVLVWYVKKYYPFLDYKVPPDMKAVDKRNAAMVHQLAGLVSFGSQTIVVSTFCGLAEGSVYSIYNLVFTGINTLCSTVSSALLAGFGNLITTESKEKLNQVYRMYECLYFAMVTFFYSVAFVLIVPFIRLYTMGIQDANYIRETSAVLFCLMGITNCLRTPGGTLINAIGHYKETKNRSIIEMLICLFLELILVKKHGINGVLIATILAYAYRTIDVIFYSNYVILKSSVKKTMQNMMVDLFSFSVFFLLINGIKIEVISYSSWIIYGLFLSVLAILVIIPMNFLFNRKNVISIKEKIYDLLKNKN